MFGIPARPRPSRFSPLLIVAAILCWLPVAWAGPTRGFASGSLDEILKSRAGRPFVMVLWSLDCPPCLQELDFLSTQLKAHPEMDLVLVSTDEPGVQVAVEAQLEKHRLAGRVESWIFADANAQKLRYEIDAGWYGELPRSYFYDAGHHRVALSGAVTERHLQTWRASKGTAPGHSP